MGTRPGRRRPYVGHLTGTRILDETDGGIDVYLTDDDRVLVHDLRASEVTEITDLHVLQALLSQDDYLAVMHALGEKPHVRL